MDYKLNIFFTSGKELSIILAKDDFDVFLKQMASNRPYKDEKNNTGIGIPLYSVSYYTFFEYTEEMKKGDVERAEKINEEARAKAVKLAEVKTETKE